MLLSCSAFMHSWVSAACGCFLAPIPQLGLPMCPPQLAGLGAVLGLSCPVLGWGGGWEGGRVGGNALPALCFPLSAQWVAQRFPIIF